MKILFLLLDHHSVKDKSKACQNTWLKNFGKEDEVIFLGDPLMPDFINGHEVYKPLPNEKKQEQNRITEKQVKAFKYIIKKEWDFLLRIDVDAYCNVDNLKNLLKSLKKDECYYYGQGICFPGNGHPCYLSNVGDILPRTKYKYYYAQGGCYLISKPALKKALPFMYFPAPIEARAEDIMVGDALKKAGVDLIDRPDLFNSGYVGKGWHGMGTRINTLEEHLQKIKDGYISTHKVSSNQIIKIHEFIKKNKSIKI